MVGSIMNMPHTHELKGEADSPAATFGFCSSCRETHALPSEPAVSHCRALMDQLAAHKTIAQVPDSKTNPELSTDYLFGKARGKMFGVLVCKTATGETQLLKAFSGQYNGQWHVPGWVDPCFDLRKFETANHEEEKRIKTITITLQEVEPHSAEWRSLRKQRRNLSRKLMQELFHLYRLTNFAGQTASLFEAFSGAPAIPTGTGDCCAPKLLNHAARNNLTPIGLAEFYWGLDSKSGARSHGCFYPSCTEKCRPLLGFMLCGIER